LKNTLIIFALIFFIAGAEIKAQSDSIPNPSAKTDECNIYLQSRTLIKNAELFGLTDTSLFYFKNKKVSKINVDDIRTIKFKGKGGFWKGALVGAAFDAFVFTMLAIAVDPGHGEGAGWNKVFLLYIGAIGLVPASLIGGFIGAMSDEDKIYEIPKGDLQVKIKKIRGIIKENS
jgi:hypothetical protein